MLSDIVSGNTLIVIPIGITIFCGKKKKRVSFSGRSQLFQVVHVLVDILNEWILLFNVK